jgi:arylsulfatase A-like enzyme
MIRPIHRRFGLLASVAAVVLGTTSCGFWNDGPPNIIVITMDTFRADRMAMYGGQGLTPTLDALARKGTVFSHAVVSSGTTYPSHATMFTGLYPRQHAVRSNFSRLPDDVPTLAEKLTAAGYDTGAFVSFKGMLVHGNLGKGFAAVSDTEQPKEMFRDGDETARMALDWLDSRIDRDPPVFLWYHNFDAHTPLRMTDYSRSRLERIGYEGPWSDGASIPEVTTIQEEIIRSELLQDAVTALYDGEVINADLAVRLLLDGLEERDILDNAVLVLVADHGEALGENGWFGHGATLWETVIRTPLVFVDFRKPRHRIVDSTVGTVDLMATLLDRVGIEPGPNQGRSLVPAMNGGELEAAEYVAEIEVRKEENRPAWYDIDRLAIYYEDFKFEYAFGKGRLFDLAEDPDAVSPLNASGEAEAIVSIYLEGLAQEFLAEGNFAGDSSLDENAINQLKSLGYVQ